jgi:Bacteriophage holin family, superfamily II-like
MNHVTNTVEASLAASGSKATWTGSAVTMFSGITSNEFGMWAGIVIGVAGLIISWYFKHKAELRYEQANRRYEEAHGAYMEKMRCHGCGDSDTPPPTPKEERES